MFSMWRVLTGQFFVIALSIIAIEFIPATCSASTSTHIVSYVHQKKLKPKFDEFADFDFGNANEKKMKHGSFSLLAGSLVKEMDMNIDIPPDSEGSSALGVDNFTNSTKPSDDSPSHYLNTLQNATDMSANHTQHVLEIAGGRVKQSIPVLEPVKHLLNTVRDGAFGKPNHTSHSLTPHHTPHSKHPHQLLGSVGSTDQAQDSGGVHQHNDSAAIETEEEREMVNESTGFHFLELLGTLGGMIWGFLTNAQKIFAASSLSSSGLSQN